MESLTLIIFRKRELNSKNQIKICAKMLIYVRKAGDARKIIREGHG